MTANPDINYHLRDHLVTVAKQQATTTYSEAAPIAGIDLSTDWGWAQMGHQLGQISTYEHEHSRPMLSALVIQKRGDGPGGGFYGEAQKLGLYHGNTQDAAYEFWIQELKHVHAYWAAHSE